MFVAGSVNAAYFQQLLGLISTIFVEGYSQETPHPQLSQILLRLFLFITFLSATIPLMAEAPTVATHPQRTAKPAAESILCRLHYSGETAELKRQRSQSSLIIFLYLCSYKFPRYASYGMSIKTITHGRGRGTAYKTSRQRFIYCRL